jgi:hypothetical protein
MARRKPSKAAQRKGGRAAARSRKSPIGRKSSSTRRRSTSSAGKRTSTRKKGSGKFIASAIKRPGALTRRAKSGKKRSVHAQAQHDMRHGSTRAKRQASFYLNVLKPASRKRKKGR